MQEFHKRLDSFFPKKARKTALEVAAALSILTGGYVGMSTSVELAKDTLSFIQQSQPKTSRTIMFGALGAITIAIIAASKSSEKTTARKIRRNLDVISDQEKHLAPPAVQETIGDGDARFQLLYNQFLDGQPVSPN
jgi:hypothetical protein